MPTTETSIAKPASDVETARQRLEQVEQDYFSGSVRLDQLRIVYLYWLAAERRARLAGVTA